MQRYESMKEAAIAATTLCHNWLVKTEGSVADPDTLLILAEAFDREFADQNNNPAAFLCSKEGAVGLTFDYEYNAQWLLYPLCDESMIQEEVIANLERDLDRLKELGTEELQEIWKR